MPTPPAAGDRWKSISSRVTSPRRLRPSYVAALMMRFRNVTGPSLAEANASGTIASAMLLLSPVRMAPKAGGSDVLVAAAVRPARVRAAEVPLLPAARPEALRRAWRAAGRGLHGLVRRRRHRAARARERHGVPAQGDG